MAYHTHSVTGYNGGKLRKIYNTYLFTDTIFHILLSPLLGYISAESIKCGKGVKPLPYRPRRSCAMLAGMSYTAATPTDLTNRYPAMGAYAEPRQAYWLDDARTRIVLDSDWDATNGPVAQILVAAHNLTLEGSVADEADGGVGMAGVTQMRSGQLSLSFDASLVAAQAEGGWMATKYGAQFLALLKLTKGGPRVTGLGIPACGGYWRDSLLTGVVPY